MYLAFGFEQLELQTFENMSDKMWESVRFYPKILRVTRIRLGTYAFTQKEPPEVFCKKRRSYKFR